ncbi:MAG: hypothetical protein V4508_20800 [Pseudomonadota bacterium]
MDDRIDRLEKDLSTLKADLAVIRSNYGTRGDLERVRSELSAELHTLDIKLSVLTQRFDSELSQFVTKAELQKELRIWVGGSAIALFFALASLQFAMVSALKP